MDRPAPDGELGRGHAEAIQSVGFAILLSPEWLVERVSANIGDYVDAEAGALIGVPLAALLGGDAVHGLRNQLALLRDPASVTRMFACTAVSGCFDFSLQLRGQRVLLEGQQARGLEHGDTIATVRSLIGRLERQHSLADLLEQAATQIRALTGYDQVGVFRTAGAEGALQVQSARSRPGLPASLGANDYAVLADGSAIVADCEAAPVALLPASARRVTDGAMLAAASPSQCQLIAGLGARAAMVLPVAVGGEPWGMILCSHPAPRYPSFERQSATGLFVQMLGLLIAAAERR